ncbi:hypothetical protein BC831DRAFT_468224 [Entophlyctis helioformis]|nr:hypothetical protein BC831DRAFT_468224 [Entophlyctis helioformis]
MEAVGAGEDSGPSGLSIDGPPLPLPELESDGSAPSSDGRAGFCATGSGRGVAAAGADTGVGACAGVGSDAGSAADPDTGAGATTGFWTAANGTDDTGGTSGTMSILRTGRLKKSSSSSSSRAATVFFSTLVPDDAMGRTDGVYVDLGDDADESGRSSTISSSMSAKSES